MSYIVDMDDDVECCCGMKVKQSVCGDLFSLCVLSHLNGCSAHLCCAFLDVGDEVRTVAVFTACLLSRWSVDRWVHHTRSVGCLDPSALLRH